MSAREIIAGVLSVDLNQAYNVRQLKRADAILSALAAAGYKIVSREPTDEMSNGKATVRAFLREAGAAHGRTDWDDVWRIYWDAAPPSRRPGETNVSGTRTKFWLWCEPVCIKCAEVAPGVNVLIHASTTAGRLHDLKRSTSKSGWQLLPDGNWRCQKCQRATHPESPQ